MTRTHQGFLNACVSLSTIVLLGGLTGCLKSADSAGPLSNEKLRLLKVGEKSLTVLEKPGKHRIYNINEEQAAMLVDALSPIKSVRVGNLESVPVDYVFGVQSGRSPLSFRVQLSGNHLVYSERQHLYEGGDAKAFTQVADAVIEGN